MTITRRKTRMVSIGNVKIGGGAPISIQSMTKTDTRDINATVREARRLEHAGCEIIRVAVKNIEAAKAIKTIKKKINIPLVADIHFHYRLGLESMASGADAIRLNPGNIKKAEEIKAVVEAAKKYKVPIRIGMNSGSLPETKPSPCAQGLGKPRTCAQGRVNSTLPAAARMVKSCLKYIKFLESLNFHDIIISLKASDVLTTINANRRMAELTAYPFHLGITATGLPWAGTIKSALGIGALLLEGIGDTVRVSLTGDACQEVKAAREILAALRLRNFGPEIISCPTCGRSELNLMKITKEVEARLRRLSLAYGRLPGLKIAIMGCTVNGPGEARDADIGIAGGRGVGLLFKGGRKIKTVKEKELVDCLLEAVKEYC